MSVSFYVDIIGEPPAESKTTEVLPVSDVTKSYDRLDLIKKWYFEYADNDLKIMIMFRNWNCNIATIRCKTCNIYLAHQCDDEYEVFCTREECFHCKPFIQTENDECDKCMERFYEQKDYSGRYFSPNSNCSICKLYSISYWQTRGYAQKVKQIEEDKKHVEFINENIRQSFREFLDAQVSTL